MHITYLWEDGVANAPSPDPELLKSIQTRIDKKIREQEISTIEFWKERVDRLASMKPEGIGSLQLEIKKISAMMDNRIKTLKKDSP